MCRAEKRIGNLSLDTEHDPLFVGAVFKVFRVLIPEFPDVIGNTHDDPFNAVDGGLVEPFLAELERYFLESVMAKDFFYGCVFHGWASFIKVVGF